MKTKQNEIEVSVVIPAYKEEAVIQNTLVEVNNVVQSITKNYEIICVVDGLIDKTYEKAAEVSKKSTKIKTIGYVLNRGKGFALRLGFERCKGKIIGFIDADGQINARALKTAIQKIKNGHSIVIGSKKHTNSQVDYPLSRKLISNLSQKLIKVLFRISVNDTQAGLKLFKKDIIKKILPNLTVNRYAIDVEILAIANKLGIKDIIEIPLIVTVDRGKKDSASLTDLFQTFMAVIKIFIELKSSKINKQENTAKTDKVQLIES
jgi:dolichol-phosphate mannosyltransferase